MARESSPDSSRFFLSADDVSYHELAAARESYPHATPGFHPLLTRTPGLVSMGVFNAVSNLKMLRNDPERPERLETITFERLGALRMKNAALYVYGDGELPALEGGLSDWWARMMASGPVTQVPTADLLDVVGRIAHKINNGFSVINCNGATIEEALSSFTVLFNLLAQSTAVREAIKQEMQRQPECAVALDEIAALVPDPVTDEDPLQILCAAIADLQVQHRDVCKSSEKIMAFVRATQTRMPAEVPIGATDPKEIVRECEEGERPVAAQLIAPIAAKDSETVTAPLLVVEDMEEVRNLLVTGLGRKGFSNLIAVPSYSEALKAADSLPDLSVILTDFNLTGRETGQDLVRHLRRTRPNLRVVFLTGNEGEMNGLLTGEETSLYDRFAKPMEIGKLAGRLKEIFATFTEETPWPPSPPPPSR
jgi:CheY-like chemotaxis protein